MKSIFMIEEVTLINISTNLKNTTNNIISTHN